MTFDGECCKGSRELSQYRQQFVMVAVALSWQHLCAVKKKNDKVHSFGMGSNPSFGGPETP